MYCKACQSKRQSSTECEGCTRPELLPEVRATANLFDRCGTQWRYKQVLRDNVFILQPAGLDYHGVSLVARMMDIKLKPVFNWLQAMEIHTINLARENK